MNSGRVLTLTLHKFPRTLTRDWMNYPGYEFHILRSLREAYEFDASLFSITGNMVFAGFHAVRTLATKMNAHRDLTNHPGGSIRPGHLNAMGLIDEIYHHVLRLYEETANPKAFARAQEYLVHELGDEGVRNLTRKFVGLFPSSALYRNEIGAEEYLTGTTRGKPNSEAILEELVLLYFANFNPAFRPFKELFDDAELREHTMYARAIDHLETFFRGEKHFGPEDQHIFDLLRAPILANSNSLEGQLAYIRQRWGMMLSEKFLERMLSAGDLIQEDLPKANPGGAAQTVVPTYTRGSAVGTDAFDYERFSTDLEWMPKVVILAKNTFVWLDQLSKKYKRSITMLDEIPDEELDRLAGWNFTGLWLIGIWQRSVASQRIKQLTGNPEAVASAYSLFEYEIASDLGGEEAFQNLRRRTWERGIRLAGDMVPNHVGIYSRWVIEHPDYFIQSSQPPFPGYRFTGANLSDDSRVEIRIEDRYWNRTDAAVVFQRIDRSTGGVRYVYHGNDGTTMPWNDTAQLDFLRAEVREAVVQSIFHVARKFSVIRFDAAMVLAKKHFQRLWYPQPGTGGAIPSRSDQALAEEEFERLFPQEFWREVVDRINAEMPNTLLLAEAFWLLEGYFVRTLGMHRVYNSAFMHMLMKEENRKYRELIRNTLHYNPEILKRYVNFMSNPDEQTAIEQFGKGDKYFGIAILMVTLPGLPMFAHGQIEGLKEKYGMEYRRAYHDEHPDEDMIRRHEQEIFPLMAKRHLFGQVTDFEMYDFIDTGGNLNENVFVYSNMGSNMSSTNSSIGERALVCYHNKYEETAGWVKMSVGKTASAADDPNPAIISKTLAEALRLKRGPGVYYVFRDAAVNLEFIRSGTDLHERGIYLELKAFQYHVFLDFREVRDTEGNYGQIAGRLQGRGVQNIDEAIRDFQLAPVHDALAAILADDAVDDFATLLSPTQEARADEKRASSLIDRFRNLLRQIESVRHLSLPIMKMSQTFFEDIGGIRMLVGNRSERSAGGRLPEWLAESKLPIDATSGSKRPMVILLGWIVVRALLDALGEKACNDLHLGRVLERAFGQWENGSSDARLVRLLAISSNPFSQAEKGEIPADFLAVLENDDAREFLQVNSYNGTVYYNKESFELLLRWILTTSIIRRLAGGGSPRLLEGSDIRAMVESVKSIVQESGESGCRLDELKTLIRREQEKLHIETSP